MNKLQTFDEFMMFESLKLKMNIPKDIEEIHKAFTKYCWRCSS